MQIKLHTSATLHRAINHYRMNNPDNIDAFFIQLHEQIKKWMKILKSFNSPKQRLEFFRDTLDELIHETVKDQKVSCGMGCSYCCHQHVAILPDELPDLVAIAKELNIDMDRLKAQAAKETTAEEFMLLPNNACVFLDSEGDCRAYKKRPANCRKHYVNTAPELCADPTAHVGFMILWQAEILVSAMMNISNLPKRHLLHEELYKALSQAEK